MISTFLENFMESLSEDSSLGSTATVLALLMLSAVSSRVILICGLIRIGSCAILAAIKTHFQLKGS